MSSTMKHVFFAITLITALISSAFSQDQIPKNITKEFFYSKERVQKIIADRPKKLECTLYAVDRSIGSFDNWKIFTIAKKTISLDFFEKEPQVYFSKQYKDIWHADTSFRSIDKNKEKLKFEFDVYRRDITDINNTKKFKDQNILVNEKFKMTYETKILQLQHEVYSDKKSNHKTAAFWRTARVGEDFGVMGHSRGVLKVKSYEPNSSEKKIHEVIGMWVDDIGDQLPTTLFDPVGLDYMYVAKSPDLKKRPAMISDLRVFCLSDKANDEDKKEFNTNSLEEIVQRGIKN